MTRAGVVPVVALLLAGCSSEKPSRTEPNRAGAALEDAAIRSGLVDDPMTLNPVGAYASATDQVCVMRRGEGYIVGASVSYGEQQTCVARGTATATGGKTLRLDFGERCRFDARFDGKESRSRPCSRPRAISVAPAVRPSLRSRSICSAMRKSRRAR